MIKQEIEKNKITAQIKNLIAYLPRYAEEEGDFYSVPREDLINALCSEQVNQDVAKNTVEFCENLLDTLAHTITHKYVNFLKINMLRNILCFKIKIYFKIIRL